MMFDLPNKDKLIGAWLRDIEQQVDYKKFRFANSLESNFTVA